MRIRYPILSANLKLRYLIKDQPMIDLYALQESQLRDQEVEKEAIMRVEGWKRVFQLANMTSAELPQHLKEMLKKTTCLLSKMITYCIDNELQPILVIPPVSKALNRMISKEFMEVFLYKNIRQANKKIFLFLIIYMMNAFKTLNYT